MNLLTPVHLISGFSVGFLRAVAAAADMRLAPKEAKAVLEAVVAMGRNIFPNSIFLLGTREAR